MITTYLPPVRHILPLTTIRRERRLPVPGTITIRVNEKVEAQDVVAEAELSPKHYFLDISKGLGIPEREIARYLVRERGDRVDMDDIIAGPVGLARRTIRAPSDGRIVAISRGRVLFESRGEPLEVQAGFPGQVISTDGSQQVVIETVGALIQAVWGNRRRDYGVMRIVSEEREGRLDTADLDIDMRGAILVAGLCDHPSALHRAAELAVRGIVLGSLSSELIPVALRLPYPLVVIDGFGNRPMNPAAFNLMDTNAGREVSVDGNMGTAYDGQRPEVIIPLPSTQSVDLPDEVIPLDTGVRTRVLRGPHQGMIGVVRRVLEQRQRFPSGILVRSAEIDLDAGEVVTVPIENVEILQ